MMCRIIQEISVIRLLIRILRRCFHVTERIELQMNRLGFHSRSLLINIRMKNLKHSFKIH